MDKLIANFPANLREALQIAATHPLKPISAVENIVVCGMGGSGIGGKIVGQWFADELKVPFSSVQDYFLPAFVGENTLLIASSYSGNTEETIWAVEEGIKRNAHIVAICSGGKLSELAKKHNFDAIVVPGGSPPRAALAYSLVQLVHILSGLKLIDSKAMQEFAIAADYLHTNSAAIKDEAKLVSNFIGKKIPVLYSSSNFEAVSIRARQQFNENSKTLCWHQVIPEMNHNELVGWYGGSENFAPIFIKNKHVLDRNAFRFRLSNQVIKEKCKKTFVLESKGDNLMQESLYLIHVLDWASLYLAVNKKQDPIIIPVIDYLKAELDKF